jgi:hypothetical protein
MRSWGIILILLGIGSYILPMMGRQFMLVSIFGDSPLVGAAFIIVGAVLTFLGIRRGKAE